MKRLTLSQLKERLELNGIKEGDPIRCVVDKDDHTEGWKYSSLIEDETGYWDLKGSSVIVYDPNFDEVSKRYP